ncbi:hypothetical protein AX15_005217 [Amanita polypyramis BW_CC]|nr:hypothetical protein AX15_005217 [Amanita polypyramis BW_CC]
MAAALTQLHDDILISILTWLTPLDILAVRKTCKRLLDLTHARIVWTNTCVRYVLSVGYPFPNAPLGSLPIAELERSTCHAYRLGRRWRSKNPRPRWSLYNDSAFSAAISDVRFVLQGRGNDKWLVTVSKSIWSVLTLWDVSHSARGQARKCGEWSPKGGVFKSFCLDTDSSSIPTLAIALLHGGKEMMYILSIEETQNGMANFRVVTSFPTNFTPVTLQGDIVALSDEHSQISIWNWRTNRYATLHYPPQEGDALQHNACCQVLFSTSTNSILILRDQSILLFPFPDLGATNEVPVTHTPIAHHHFGWVDGITATFIQPVQTNSHPYPRDKSARPVSLLLRRKNSDPWYSDTHSIEHYILLPNPTYNPTYPSSPEPQMEKQPPPDLPYLFPPLRRIEIPNLRGSLGGLLHTSNIILGRCGTAVWINPQDRAAGGLYFGDDDSPLQIVPYVERSNEQLMAAVFHGPLSHGRNSKRAQDESDASGVDKWTVCVNDRNNWTAMDYDEDRGRIAVGSASGDLTVLML